ncbi:cell division protein ZapA [Calidifontimicrobium sp. SYSU G02091]|uniref:cell division protein ZapA n=1 Tax=Azohydromonas TaxID=312063 RepID=UPI000E652898|nr:cell division protein ZapA [Azohydromonas sediminis]MCI1193360.1 cell division protein ZapA [Calidifontimicrobium sp. SYSU G02091]
MKQIEVTILGQSYRLGCPEGGEATLLAAVATVDREMSAIRDAGKVKARERMAVLAALNLAYQLAERPANPPPAAEPARPAGAGDAEIEHLIARIDAALGDDGRLL